MKIFTTLIVALGLLQAHSQTQTVPTTATSFVGTESPYRYFVPRGSTIGGMWELAYSDNVPMILRSDNGSGMSAQLMLEGRLPIDPSRLSFTVESHVTMPFVEQTVALWDWNARAWVILGSDVLGSWDLQREYALPGDPLRFSQAGTGRMQAAIGFTSLRGAFGNPWQARVDTAFWTYAD